VRRGKPIDTTMGFMPSGGLMMATRCGDLDPGVILRLLELGLSPRQVSRVVNQRSGLLGVSGLTGDMRVLEQRASRDAACERAVRMFGYTALKFAGAMIAALGGLDTLVFSGGIGEHSPMTRARIAGGLAFAGVKLDPARNRANAPVISRPRSRITVRVIPTDEERMIARAGARLFA
jgi:acetate kinase